MKRLAPILLLLLLLIPGNGLAENKRTYGDFIFNKDRERDRDRDKKANHREEAFPVPLGQTPHKVAERQKGGTGDVSPEDFKKVVDAANKTTMVTGEFNTKPAPIYQSPYFRSRGGKTPHMLNKRSFFGGGALPRSYLRPQRCR